MAVNGVGEGKKYNNRPNTRLLKPTKMNEQIIETAHLYDWSVAFVSSGRRFAHIINRCYLFLWNFFILFVFRRGVKGGGGKKKPSRIAWRKRENVEIIAVHRAQVAKTSSEPSGQRTPTKIPGEPSRSSRTISYTADGVPIGKSVGMRIVEKRGKTRKNREVKNKTK